MVSNHIREIKIPHILASNKLGVVGKLDKGVGSQRQETMAKMSSKIEKLDKENHQQWRFDIRNYLVVRNFWSFVYYFWKPIG